MKHTAAVVTVIATLIALSLGGPTSCACGFLMAWLLLD